MSPPGTVCLLRTKSRACAGDRCWRPGTTTDPGTSLTQDYLLFASSPLTAFSTTLGTPIATINVYNNSGSLIGNGMFVQLTGGTYSGDYELVAVPEPETWATMLGGMGMLIAIQRVRRRKA